MASTKTTTLYAVLQKAEVSYNGGGSLSTSTDACQLADLPELTIQPAFDGTRPRAAHGGGWYRGARPIAWVGSSSFTAEIKGPGVAYSASQFFPDIHNWLLASGHSVTTVTTGGSETQTYAPRVGPASFDSLVMTCYTRGDLYKFTGVRGNIKLTYDGVSIPKATFDWDGLLDMASYAESLAVPTITYPYNTILPLGIQGATLTLGNLTAAVVMKAEFDAGRQRFPRNRPSATVGHAGWGFGHREPMFTCTIEKAALVGSPYTGTSTLDAYRLRDAATSVACTFDTVTPQYNRHRIVMPQAQLVDVKESDDGEAAMLDLTIRPFCSTPGLADDYTIVAY